LIYASFPLTDHDSIIEKKATRNAKTKTVTITISSIYDALPVDDKIIRVKEVYGSWVLVPINSNTNEAAYLSIFRYYRQSPCLGFKSIDNPRAL